MNSFPDFSDVKKTVIHSTSASLGYIESVNVGIHLNHPYSWMKNSVLHKYTIFWFLIILIIIQWKKNQKLKTQILQYVSSMPECLTKGINKICPNSYFFNFFFSSLTRNCNSCTYHFYFKEGGGHFKGFQVITHTVQYIIKKITIAFTFIKWKNKKDNIDMQLYHKSSKFIL